jgi:glutathione synthase/RimK-type ligase-like ATP-grasp enzyme
MSTKTILFIEGIADDRYTKVHTVQKNGSVLFEHNGSTNIYQYIKNDSFNKKQLLFDTNPKQAMEPIRFDAIFNQISDPDTHSITLLKVEAMQNSLPKEMAFFNKPSNVRKTTRESIYKLLHGIKKLHVPKTVKIQPKSPANIYESINRENFSFPVIFRQAGDHGGISTIRIDNENEQFFAFALDGRDYYLTQYVEYGVKNLYRKYRLVVIGGNVFLRHVLFGKEWLLHATNEIESEKQKNIQESKRFSREIKPLIQTTITDIYHTLGLDYFGIDCEINEKGEILVFEINANMNIFIETEGSVFKKHIEKAHQALVKMLNA